MRFFVGLHHASDAKRFDAAFISINRLRDRKSGFEVGDWIMDSGAFSTIAKYGDYPDAPAAYAAQVKRWSTNGNLLAAVSEDYMCETEMQELAAKLLGREPRTIEENQRLTIERYDALMACDVGGAYIMPVLQGYEPSEYVNHLRQYGERLKPGAWVGVGSVCKRNGSPAEIEAVLLAIKSERPDLRLHGFGLKTTALRSEIVRECLESADSMAWSFAARRNGRNGNSWLEAKRFADSIRSMPIQRRLRFFALVPQVQPAKEGA